MTWIEVEGFEVYGDDGTAGNDVEAGIDKRVNLNYVEGTGSPTSISLEVGEDQGYALTMPSTGIGADYHIDWEYPSAYQVTMNSSAPTLCIGFRMRVPEDTDSSSKVFWSLLKGSPAESAIRLEIGDDGNDLKAVYSSGTTDADDVLTPGAWHYIEIELKPASSADGGFFNVDVDGSNVIAVSGANLEIFFNSIWGMRFQQLASMGEWALDDVCLYENDGVDHTDIIGAREIHRLVPTSDATPNDWTPQSGGDNYAMVDEIELDEADYVDATTTADDDHYGLTTLDALSVDCLQIDVECDAVDGTPTLHVGFDDGTADEADDGVISTGDNTVVRKLFPQDPSSVDWTPATVNSVEATQRMTE